MTWRQPCLCGPDIPIVGRDSVNYERGSGLSFMCAARGDSIRQAYPRHVHGDWAVPSFPRESIMAAERAVLECDPCWHEHLASLALPSTFIGHDSAVRALLGIVDALNLTAMARLLIADNLCPSQHSRTLCQSFWGSYTGKLKLLPACLRRMFPCAL